MAPYDLLRDEIPTKISSMATTYYVRLLHQYSPINGICPAP